MAPQISINERTAILEEKTSEIEKNNEETDRILRGVSSQINSLCVSQARMSSTLEGLAFKIDDMRNYQEKKLDKIEEKTDKHKYICDDRYENLTKTTTKISTRQKIIFAIASIIGAGLVSLIVKIITTGSIS